ncbi:MAG: virulence protein [Lachnospirales bacterium]
MMEVKFNVAGKDRKPLVAAISEITGVKSKYKGMPTSAYEIDCFTVDKEGTLIFDDKADSEEIKTLLVKLAEKGFVAEITEESNEHTNTSEEGQQSENVGLTVAMPATYFVEDALKNLQHIIEAKGNLIKKALGLNSLPILEDDDKVSFPWFSFMPEDSDTSRPTRISFTVFVKWQETRNASVQKKRKWTMRNTHFAVFSFD